MSYQNLHSKDLILSSDNNFLASIMIRDNKGLAVRVYTTRKNNGSNRTQMKQHLQLFKLRSEDTKISSGALKPSDCRRNVCLPEARLKSAEIDSLELEYVQLWFLIRSSKFRISYLL